MYFETASLALSSVLCAISRIFSACSLICSLIVLSIPDAVAATSSFQRGPCRSLRRFSNPLQLLAEFIHQHARIFRVINGNHDEVYAAALERVFERRDQRVHALDP